MNWLNKIKPEAALRVGLGAMYLYSGYDIVRHPSAWTWAIRGLPLALQQGIEAVGLNNFLVAQGYGELLFGLILVLWFMPKRLVKWVAFLSALEMLAIILLVGLDTITFRDIGLLGASTALWLIYLRK